MIKDPYKIILRPVITEKSTVMKEKNREICFEVQARANKLEIKEAVERLFNVKIESVRVLKQHGKCAESDATKAGPKTGRRPT